MKKDIIAITDFSREQIMHILQKADELAKSPTPSALSGKVLATLFFEPSTRTRLSFETAMHRLGGSVIGFSDSANTSVQKGETLRDTIKVVEGYADAIVIRHPSEGSARFAAEISAIPVINAGDGANQHPTQTFLDLYTIYKAKGRLTNLRIGILGDLKYGRTVHSLVCAFHHFFPTFEFIAPDLLRLPAEYREELLQKGIRFSEHRDIQAILPELDVLYATRIQKERFVEPLEYQRVKGSYQLKPAMFSRSKDSLIILHPLPRVDEIHHSLDKEYKAMYFQQAHNGVPIRQALLSEVFN